MDYRTYSPHTDLCSLVKFHWTLEVPAVESRSRQRILPDGCVDMIFILGDDIRRIGSENDHVIQPRAMILGQITEPFDIEPEGYVNSFAIRFHPYGICGFLSTPISDLSNKETPLAVVFGQAVANGLEQAVAQAADTAERIAVVERFLLQRIIGDRFKENLAKQTVQIILSTNGSTPINAIIRDDPAKRRRLERMFCDRIGTSPKQLSKVVRLQAALSLMLNKQEENLTQVAYDSSYYDQAHFIKDFKEFTGLSPSNFLDSELMTLSSKLYWSE